jgi:hypothetical protein
LRAIFEKPAGICWRLGWMSGGEFVFARCKVKMKKAEHIATRFEPFATDSLLAGSCPADVHNRDPKPDWRCSAAGRRNGDGVLAKAENLNVVFCQMAPWDYGPSPQMNLKRTYRRASFLVSRLLADMGVSAATPILERFSKPVDPKESRWLDGDVSGSAAKNGMIRIDSFRW